MNIVPLPAAANMSAGTTKEWNQSVTKDSRSLLYS